MKTMITNLLDTVSRATKGHLACKISCSNNFQ